MAPKLDKAKTKVIGIQVHRTQTRSFVWQIVRGILRLIGIVGALALVWYITRLPLFTITEVTVSGGETIPHDEVRASVLQELQGSYFLIIPKRFTYLYPHERIYEVVAKNTRMHDIVITRTSTRELSVSFKEYIPYALWCSYSASTSPCLFMTKEGYAFTEAPILLGGALVRYTDENVDEVLIGQVRTVEQLNDTEYFIERMDTELGLRTASVLFKKSGDIAFSINGGGQIFVSGGKDFVTAFANLNSILKSSEFKHIKPGNFKYIDVRFDNKVFVNDAMDEVTSTTTEGSIDLSE